MRIQRFDVKYNLGSIFFLKNKVLPEAMLKLLPHSQGAWKSNQIILRETDFQFVSQ